MRKIILFIILFLITNSVVAKNWIVFHAYNVKIINERSPGHVFISFIEDDKVTQQTRFETWGFHPFGEEIIDGIKSIGDLKDDIGAAKEISFPIEVTKKEFEVCLKRKEIWEFKSYSVLSNDCISFAMDIVQVLNSMRKTKKIIEPNKISHIPIIYLSSLKKLNSQLYATSFPGEINYKSNQLSNIKKEVAFSNSNLTCEKITFNTYLDSLKNKNVINKKLIKTIPLTANKGGGKTPDELGRLIIKALATNNRNLWNSCILPPEGHIKTEQTNEMIELSQKRFDDIKSDLEENGVSNFSLMKYSRVTYQTLPKNDKNPRQEKELEYFTVEFDYSPEFYGKIAKMNVVSFNNNNYFIYSIQNGSNLFRK